MPSHSERNAPVLMFGTVRELETHLSGAYTGSAGFWFKLTKQGGAHGEHRQGRGHRGGTLFELDRANRVASIYRVNDARRAEMHARRIANLVQMLARGETIHPRKTPKAATHIS